MSVFEAGMMVCFGVSWPIAAYKTYRAKSVKGKSLTFSFLILITLQMPWPDHSVQPDINLQPLSSHSLLL